MDKNGIQVVRPAPLPKKKRKAPIAGWQVMIARRKRGGRGLSRSLFWGSKEQFGIGQSGYASCSASSTGQVDIRVEKRRRNRREAGHDQPLGTRCDILKGTGRPP